MKVWQCIRQIELSNFLKRGLKLFIFSMIRMGIINNDVYTASNGVQKAGTYICFANETIYLTQQGGASPFPPSDASVSSSEPMYSVRANYRVYWDQDSRVAGKGFIDLQSVYTTVSRSDLNSNLYDHLYAVLKKTYTNTVDELTVRTPPAPPAPPAPANPSSSSIPIPDPSSSAPVSSDPSSAPPS